VNFKNKNEGGDGPHARNDPFAPRPGGSEFARRIGWGAFLLPFMEQNNLYAKFLEDTENFEKNPFDFDSASEAPSDVPTESIPLFICPSDASPDGDKNAYYTHNELGAVGALAGKSCYVANVGANFFGRSVRLPRDTWGPFSRNSQTTFADILDGSTNTIFLGERSSNRPQTELDPYGAVWAGRCNVVDSFRAGNTNAVRLYGWSSDHGLLGMVGTPTSSLGVIEWGVNGNRPGVGLVSSSHPGGGNAGLGDGSVHFLSDNTGYDVLQNLAQMADGNFIKPF